MVRTRAEQLVEGLKILLRYEPDADFAAEHDEFFFGGIKPEDVSEADRAALEACGFFYHETYESWARFT